MARATATITLCAVRFLYEQSLHRPWTTLRFVRPQREKKLPVVLSRDEVRTILAEVRLPVYRACLTTIYALWPAALGGTPGSRCPRSTAPVGSSTCQARDKHDRYVPLPADDPEAACARHWRTHRSPRWLFPARAHHGTTYSVASEAGPITRSSLQSAFHRAPGAYRACPNGPTCTRSATAYADPSSRSGREPARDSGIPGSPKSPTPPRSTPISPARCADRPDRSVGGPTKDL